MTGDESAPMSFIQQAAVATPLTEAERIRRLERTLRHSLYANILMVELLEAMLINAPQPGVINQAHMNLMAEAARKLGEAAGALTNERPK